MKNNIYNELYSNDIALIESFKEYVMSGQKPFIVLKNISKNSMKRVLSILFIHQGEITIFPYDIIAKINGAKNKNTPYMVDFIMKGYGMNMFEKAIEDIHKALKIELKAKYKY